MIPSEVAGLTAGIAGATGGLAVGGWQYAALWPTSQTFGATVVDAPDADRARHTVALTFDDGPSVRNTPALLDVLAAAEVHATFFLIGNHVRRHPQLARRIADAGHLLGNHTLMHPNLSRKALSRVRGELLDGQAAIADATGRLPTVFRPPYGARRPAVERVARELGMTPVMWNVTTQDWTEPSHDRLWETVQKGLARNRRRGRTSNLLFHDASHLDGAAPYSRAATVSVVAALVGQAELQFVPVSAWL